MENHLTFEEMSCFLTARNNDEAFRTLASRVNGHIMKCEECRKQYFTMLNAQRAIEEAVRNKAPSDSTVASPEMAFLPELRERLRITIKSTAELVVEAIDNAFCFYYPTVTTVLKSHNPGKQAPVIKSAVVDDIKNRISISGNMLSLYFDKSIFGPGFAVAITRADDHTKVFRSEFQDYNAKMVVAHFEDVESGDYIISFQE